MRACADSYCNVRVCVCVCVCARAESYCNVRLCVLARAESYCNVRLCVRAHAESYCNVRLCVCVLSVTALSVCTAQLLLYQCSRLSAHFVLYPVHSLKSLHIVLMQLSHLGSSSAVQSLQEHSSLYRSRLRTAISTSLLLCNKHWSSSSEVVESVKVG